MTSDFNIEDTINNIIKLDGVSHVVACWLTGGRKGDEFRFIQKGEREVTQAEIIGALEILLSNEPSAKMINFLNSEYLVASVAESMMVARGIGSSFLLFYRTSYQFLLILCDDPAGPCDIQSPYIPFLSVQLLSLLNNSEHV